MKKVLLVTLCVFTALLMLTPQQAFSADPVKIGVLVPLSGIVAQGGQE